MKCVCVCVCGRSVSVWHRRDVFARGVRAVVRTTGGCASRGVDAKRRGQDTGYRSGYQRVRECTMYGYGYGARVNCARARGLSVLFIERRARGA